MAALNRQDMIMKNMPLVAFVVSRMSSDNHKTLGLDREDALAYGIEGLIQAVDAFDPERGTSFASFAVRRIRGSILDAIRKADPLPRSVRRSAREIEAASQDLAGHLGRWPTHKEVAVRLGTPVEHGRRCFQHTSSDSSRSRTPCRTGTATAHPRSIPWTTTRCPTRRSPRTTPPRWSFSMRRWGR
jgi:RNA polymerase sigma factor for flagellar operon FliA